MGIIFPLVSSAFAGGDNRFHILLACLHQYGVAVIGAICKELVCGQPCKQFSGGYRIVYVARREKNTHRVAKGINNSMDFTRQSALCASDCLSEVPPFAPVAC